MEPMAPLSFDFPCEMLSYVSGRRPKPQPRQVHQINAPVCRSAPVQRD